MEDAEKKKLSQELIIQLAQRIDDGPIGVSFIDDAEICNYGVRDGHLAVYLRLKDGRAIKLEIAVTVDDDVVISEQRLCSPE